MTKIKQIGEEDRQAWNDYIKSQGGDIYQRFEWQAVFKKAYGLSSYLLAAFEGEKIVGVLPFTVIRMPFSPKIVSGAFSAHRGVITNDRNVFEKLIEEMNGIALKLGIGNIQIRQKTPLELPAMFQDIENVNMCLSLKTTADDTFQSIGRTSRKHIKKSLKHNFETKMGKDYMDSFYEVYSIRMRELGTPCHGLTYWNNIMEAFPKNSGIITVWDKDKVIAGMFFLYDEESFYDEIAIALPTYRIQCAYYFLHWQAIVFAVEKGCTKFDFRRSQKETGTYKFKKQWGAEEEQLFYYNTQQKSISGDKEKFQFATNLWAKLPLSLTKLSGPYLRKFLP